MAGGGGGILFSRNLPSVDQIKPDQFPIATEVYDEHGEVIGEFYVERRYLLPYQQIPKAMVEAITSAEDSDFFEHGGVDIAQAGNAEAHFFFGGGDVGATAAVEADDADADGFIGTDDVGVGSGGEREGDGRLACRGGFNEGATRELAHGGCSSWPGVC